MDARGSPVHDVAVADVADRDGRAGRPPVAPAGRGSRSHAHPLGGDDPDRAGLLDTPRRVINAYPTSGLPGRSSVPAALFEEIAGYDEIVVLRDIRFVSPADCWRCIGRAHTDTC